MKKLKYLIPLIIGIAVAVVCAKRWNTWFGNPVEPAYESFSEPNRIQLTFGNEGEFSRNISWQCGDKIEASEVALVKTGTPDTLHFAAQGKRFETVGGITVSYHTELGSLQSGAYCYNVRTGGKQSAWYEFRMKDDNNDFSFIYLGDIQDTVNGTAKSFFSRVHHWQPDADFWLLGGDVIERPHDQYWNEYFLSMDSIRQVVPIIAIPGNHEYLKNISRQLEDRFIYTFSYFLKSRYENHAVYCLRYGNAAIITLDSNRDFWTLPSQNRWLEQALEQCRDAEWKIVALHHPIYSVHGKMNNLMSRMAFNSLLQKHDVDLVLQGHEHGYARMISKTDEGMPATPVHVVGNASPKDYRLYFNEKYDIFGNGMRFYSDIKINRDSLIFKTFTENNDLYDDILLVKNGNRTEVSDLAVNLSEHLEINARAKKMKQEKLEKYQQEIKERLAK